MTHMSEPLPLIHILLLATRVESIFSSKKQESLLLAELIDEVVPLIP